MSDFKRKRLFVDARVQGGLLLRAAAYWLFCLLSIMMIVLCWRILFGPARIFYKHFDDMWFHFGPALVASLLLLPLVLWDTLRFSNRFVGALFRFRRDMRALARGEHVEPLRFRKGDFWGEMAEEFNAVVARIQGEPSNASGEEASSSTAESPSDHQDADRQVALASHDA